MLTAYGFSHIFFLPNFSVQTNLIPTNSISPLVAVILSQYINIKYVTIISLILVFLPLSGSIRQEINSKLHRIQKFLTILLTKIFTSILPLYYIFGYMLKLFYDGTFLLLVKYYLPIILSNIIVVVTYILSCIFIS